MNLAQTVRDEASPEESAQKGERDAEDFLRWLYRGRRLTEEELAGQLRALDELAAGKLQPALAPAANPLSAEAGFHFTVSHV